VKLSRLLLVIALSACRRAPPPPGPPELVEVRVVNRTPPGVGAPLDEALLGARAADALGRSSGMRVVDGGSPSARARWRLRVEVRLDGAEDAESKKGIARAFVSARLSPDGASPGELSFEQAAVAERVYDLGTPLDWRAHAVRAVEDVARSLGARVRLGEGPAEALVAALDGADGDLRDEAMRLAGERRERRAVPSLLKLLAAEDTAVRDRAIGTLAAIGDPRAVRPLTEVARFRDVAELPKVLDALGAIGGEEARAYLEFVASGHDSEEMRALAKKALEHLQARASHDLGAR
jgi:hypothetical protein